MLITKFKLKALVAAVAAIAAAQSALAVEFAQGVSGTTSALQEAALQDGAAAQKAPAAQMKPASVQADEWLQRHGMVRGETVRPGASGEPESLVIQVGVFTQKTSARTLSTVRNVGATAAVLDAKAQIIRFLQTSASASITNVMPKNDAFGTEYDRQKADVENQINDLMAEYELALEEVDKEKSRLVAGITYDDLMKNGISACLAKYGVEIDPSDFEGKTRERIAELEKQAKVIDERLDGLTKLQQELKGKLNNEQNTETELLSSMVLTGAIVVNSFESLIDNQYEVAVVVSWSAPQERFIRSLIGYEGKPQPFKPTSKKTREEYVNSMRWERVSGGRWIVSKDGVPRLYAVGAAELRNNQSHTKTAARQLANTNAMANLALALQSDVMSHQMARARVQNLKDGKGGEEVQTAEEIASQLSASVKNLQIQGASLVVDKIATSPLTGKPVHICVYEYSPVGKKLAKELFDKQRDTAVEFGKDQQQMRGYYDESRAQIDAARQDQASYEEGRSDAAASAAAAQAASQSAGSTTGAAAATSGSAPAGVNADGSLKNSAFGGEGEEDFAF